MTILGRGRDHVIDRHVAADGGHRGLRQLAGAAEPPLHRAEHGLIAAVLERDADAGQVCGE